VPPGADRRRAPGRPRSREADAAITRATMELLSEVGYEALTVEHVAARAGVGKSTLYRRFPAKSDLVVATIAGIVQQAAPGGSDGIPAREALREMLRDTAGIVAIPGALGMLGTLASGRPADREIARSIREQVMGPPLRQVGERMAAAVAAGEIRANTPIDVALTALWGALIARQLSGEPLDGAWLDRLLSVVWDGIAPTSRAPQTPE